MTIGTWIARVEGGFMKAFTSDEQAVIEFLTPLAKQIEASAVALGKQDVQAGLQVLKDAAMSAVQAGATALANGADPVKAAEAQFLVTGAAEGVTAIHNAESGAIKAAVAIVQQATQATAVVSA